MDSSSTTLLAGRKRVIGELSRGREFADQLRLMLRPDAAPSAQDLVGKILHTFTHSISILDAVSAALDGADSDEVSQVPAVLNSPPVKAEDSGDSCKTPPTPKDRRGCYKRKKTSDTWTKDSPTSFDDGHAWRKYGQKAILKAKYPRNYFRCTHKFDQGCQASKQVQQIQDDPPLVRTTYHGHHTCKNPHKSAHHIIIDSATEESSIIWTFGQAQESAGFKPENSFLFDSSSEERAGIKQEMEDCFIPSDLTVQFDDPNDNRVGAFSSGSDHGDVVSSDVYSCTASTRDIDMDIMVDSVFDDFLNDWRV